MLDMKKVMAGVVVATGGLFSTQAMAETTGSLNLTSEYMFRGIVSSGGAAIQGSLDWSSPTGVYAGAWASNTSPTVDGNELDLYFGWAGDMGNGLGVDLGFVYYMFSEDGEVNEPGQDEDIDYWEIYGGLSYGGLSGSVYYADDFFAYDGALISTGGATGDGSMVYLTLAYTATIKEGLDITFQVGHNSGEGIEAALLDLYGSTDDTYVDWSITTSKDLGNGWGASFAYVQTDIDSSFVDLDDDGIDDANYSDDAKFVVSLSKEFDL